MAKILKRLFGGGRDERLRQPRFAGLLYPEAPDALADKVRAMLDAVEIDGEGEGERRRPKALIVPHSELDVSGPVAASAYRRLVGLAAGTIERVVVLGPSQRVPFRGVCVPTVDGFAIPGGRLPIDRQDYAPLEQLAFGRMADDPHDVEPSIEVQLPFLREVLGEVKLVPVLVGDAPSDYVAEALEGLWGGPETLIVLASELSRDLPVDEAEARDAATVAAIEALDADALSFGDVVARSAVQGLLKVAKRKGLEARCVERRTSADAGGPAEAVVGYGAFVIA